MQLGPECHDLFATGSQTHLEVLQALARERGMTLTAGCVNLCFRFGGDRLAPALQAVRRDPAPRRPELWIEVLLGHAKLDATALITHSCTATNRGLTRSPRRRGRVKLLGR